MECGGSPRFFTPVHVHDAQMESAIERKSADDVHRATFVFQKLATLDAAGHCVTFQMSRK